MRISDWSSDVCSSDLIAELLDDLADVALVDDEGRSDQYMVAAPPVDGPAHRIDHQAAAQRFALDCCVQPARRIERLLGSTVRDHPRSEEHTSELQSLMRISSAVFCLKKKIKTYKEYINIRHNKQNKQQ